MKIPVTLSFLSLLGLNLLIVIVMTLGKVDNTWCRSHVRRHWRFPPPPNPYFPPIGSPPPNNGLRPHDPNFRRPFPAHLPGRPHIILYQHENHNGLKYEQTVGSRCYNLPNVINDKASSVDTNNRCVMLCEHRDCFSCKKVSRGTKGHYRLSEIGLDDAVTSMKPCGEIYE